MDELPGLVERLREAAQAADHRRLLVLHGPREATYEAATAVLEALGPDGSAGVLVADAPIETLELEHVALERAEELLGTTQPLLVLDAHDALDPNVLGRTVGTVDGGGLYVLLAPPLERWPDQRDGFDAHLAVPPFEAGDVAGRFRQRLIGTLRDHDGVAIVDAATGAVEDRGDVSSPGDRRQPDISIPANPSFAREVYKACRTDDQAKAVSAMEALLDPGSVVVVEADRGRGKSSAAGLAAGALMADERSLLVTAPRFGNAREVFARTREVLEALGLGFEEDPSGRSIRVPGGASLSFRPPAPALEEIARDGAPDPPPDAIIVDEAAGLPVGVLSRLLDAGVPVAFATTIHGYEGAGRGFSVRFRDRLAASPRAVTEVRMDAPIRHAPDDPVEAWAFDALLLDAAPAPKDVVAKARPETTSFRPLDRDALLDDPRLLREAFGLLVLAHYRTTPADLARMLDAPNIAVHALTVDGHVVSVALVAREGGLPEALRTSMYEGQRVRGNMLPDVLTSQLRDEAAARPVGHRVMRIATHPAVRHRGLGSALLEHIRDEAQAGAEGVDWLGTGYGATPELVDFWRDNGYAAVHLSTRRNATSGEHSVLMLDPITEEGQALTERSTRWMVERIPSVLSDALSHADPDVVRAVLASVDASIALDLTDRAWRLVACAAYGPGMYDVAPAPFRRLAMKHLVERQVQLGADAERLLVAKVLQARPWEAIVDLLELHSRREAMLALGDAYKPLVDAYGGVEAEKEADRFR